MVERALASGEVIYGVTTGFGSLADVTLTADHSSALQHGLIRSHAVAVGNELSAAEVRAMLALRAHVLALGCSGVRAEVANRFVDLLEQQILPVVPEQGSLGASGDLAPLAHLALGAIGEGMVRIPGAVEPVAARAALQASGLEPLTLEAKEGLALINGTQGMTAVGALAASSSRTIRPSSPTSPPRSRSRPSSAPIGRSTPASSAYDRTPASKPRPATSSGSSPAARSSPHTVTSHHIVQDAYSIRCAPQVHGAVRDVLSQTIRTLEIELASVSDNPIVLTEDGEILSCGQLPRPAGGTRL